MRLFHLIRDIDESGVSGEGVVAEGVEFSNGMCAFTWLTPYRKVDIAENIRTVQKIHGHEGKTKVVWIYDSDPVNTVPDTVDEAVSMEAAGPKDSFIDPTVADQNLDKNGDTKKLKNDTKDPEHKETDDVKQS